MKTHPQAARTTLYRSIMHCINDLSPVPHLGRTPVPFALLLLGLALASCSSGGDGGGSVSPAAAPVLVGYSEPDAVYAVDRQVTANRPQVEEGLPASWAVEPDLPEGLVLDPTSGEISGVPRSSSEAAEFVITAANDLGQSTAAVRITVVDPPEVFGYEQDPALYSVGAPVTRNRPQFAGLVSLWTIEPALPTGLVFDETDGSISGTPAVVANATHTIRASNAAGSDEVGLLIEVQEDSNVVLLVTPAVGGGLSTGSSDHAVISADGGTVVFGSGANDLVSPELIVQAQVFRATIEGSDVVVSLLSRALGGGDGNQRSDRPDPSSDGRVIAFESLASDLVLNDNNGAADIFIAVEDEPLRRIEKLAGGSGLHPAANRPAVSGDGRFIVFQSESPDFVLEENNFRTDIFRYELAAEGIVRVSQESPTVNSANFDPDISDDGQRVVYAQRGLLTPAGQVGTSQIVVYDFGTDTTTIASFGPGGVDPTFKAERPSISGDGNVVAYESRSKNLVPGVTTGDHKTNIFIVDLAGGGPPQLASIGFDGQQSNDDSFFPIVSHDGRYVVFQSKASNLVDDDENGHLDVFRFDRLTSEVVRMNKTADGQEASGSLAGTVRPSISGDGSFGTFTSHFDYVNGVSPQTIGQQQVWRRALE